MGGTALPWLEDRAQGTVTVGNSAVTGVGDAGTSAELQTPPGGEGDSWESQRYGHLFTKAATPEDQAIHCLSSRCPG